MESATKTELSADHPAPCAADGPALSALNNPASSTTNDPAPSTLNGPVPSVVSMLRSPGSSMEVSNDESTTMDMSGGSVKNDKMESLLSPGQPDVVPAGLGSPGLSFPVSYPSQRPLHSLILPTFYKARKPSPVSNTPIYYIPFTSTHWCICTRGMVATPSLDILLIADEHHTSQHPATASQGPTFGK